LGGGTPDFYTGIERQVLLFVWLIDEEIRGLLGFYFSLNCFENIKASN
jgi:hypothetical protein